MHIRGIAHIFDIWNLQIVVRHLQYLVIQRGKQLLTGVHLQIAARQGKLMLITGYIAARLLFIKIHILFNSFQSVSYKCIVSIKWVRKKEPQIIILIHGSSQRFRTYHPVKVNNTCHSHPDR
ncbi:hypothetical protein D3C74_363740 [compost metagenome]